MIVRHRDRGWAVLLVLGLAACTGGGSSPSPASPSPASPSDAPPSPTQTPTDDMVEGRTDRMPTPRDSDAAPGAGTDATPVDRDALVGRWQKITDDPCADRYPLQIDVRAGGIYLSQADPKAFCLWQSGDWELTDEGRLKIQIANDKMVPYRVALEESDTEGDTLRVTDEEGCVFRYRRVG